MFTGVKVFSATKQKERDELGDVITRWIRSQGGTLKIVNTIVTQSSDNEYHCLTITIFFDRE